MIWCCFTKRFLFVALQVFMAFNLACADPYDSLRPKFNYALLKELKNSGEKNVLNLPVGAWVEYFADSGVWKESIEMRDVGNNLHPPHRIFLVKCVGEYVEGKKNGVWSYYRTYDNRQPLKWTLVETWTYNMGQAEGMFKCYYSSGELMEEVPYKKGQQDGVCRFFTRKGQVTSLMTYSNGKAEGKTERYSAEGVLLLSGEIREDFFHGVWKEYYPNGQLRTALEYNMGKPWNFLEAYSRYGASLDRGTLKNGTGTYYQYNEGGIRVASFEVENGKVNGIVRIYYITGDLKEESEYQMDTMVGVHRAFYPHGGLMSLQTIKDGVTDGPFIDYYRNGKIKSENLYKKGKLWATVYANDTLGNKINCGNVKMGCGMVIFYDDTGRLSTKERYSFGFREGLTEKFYPNGQLQSSLNYLLDLAHGEYRSYTEKGELETILNYNEGMVDGYGAVYYSNGKTASEFYYYRDRLWEMISTYDSNGRKLSIGTLKQGSGQLNDYYPGGSLHSVQNLVDGILHGEATAYYEDGKLYGKYNYAYDSLVGLQKEYWSNGQVAAARLKNSNAQDEILTQYHSDGSLWTEWTYDNGLLWEVSDNLDKNGKPHYKGTFSKGTGTVMRYNEKDSVIFEYRFINGYCLNCELDSGDLHDDE